jgi:protocatechuate 3,4-dioxygenase beta subunit
MAVPVGITPLVAGDSTMTRKPHGPGLEALLQCGELSRRSFGMGLAASTALGGCPVAGPPSGLEWATGGTAAMTGPYPDPFTTMPTSCPLLCEMALGPCYSETLEREDISEGVDGLPVRLSFLVVDETCTPVQGAVVDVWHTAPNGLYSGAEAAEMCTTGDPEAVASRWFRGTRTTDTRGRVDFDTCFPGWYPQRTVHIHFQIRRDDREYVTSQLVFDQDLVDGICATHPAYEDRGLPDTTNTTDFIVRDVVDAHLVRTRRMDDGVMQAYKVLVIRSSLSDPLCSEGPDGS